MKAWKRRRVLWSCLAAQAWAVKSHRRWHILWGGGTGGAAGAENTSAMASFGCGSLDSLALRAARELRCGWVGASVKQQRRA